MATSSTPTNLFSMARSKLHLSLGSKDQCSLHRWVLLKNSISKSNPPSPISVTSDSRVSNHVYTPDEPEEEEEETDSFMFPDAGKLVDTQADAVVASEAGWLDSLLETLGDEEEDEDVQVSVLPVDEDEYQLLSPLVSPMSSSDDLVNQPDYYPSPAAVPCYPYPVPYPPFHPHLIRSCELESTFNPVDSRIPCHDPLPYYDLDDVDDLSVPDAIDDDSDDESDTPATPSLIHSNSSSMVDPASVPLPEERGRRRRHEFHVYIGPDDSHFFNPFETDPHLDSGYSEC